MLQGRTGTAGAHSRRSCARMPQWRTCAALVLVLRNRIKSKSQFFFSGKSNRILKSANRWVTITNCGHFHFNSFKQVSVDDVKIHIKAAPSKQCALDPRSTWLIKKCSDLISRLITNIINASISTENFPTTWKTAIIKPLIKKLN